MRRVSANKNVLISRLNSVRQMSYCRSSAGILFYSRGLATPKLLSPSLLYNIFIIHWRAPSTSSCLIFLVTSEPHKLWHLDCINYGCLQKKEYTVLYTSVTLYCMNFIILWCVALRLSFVVLCPCSHEILAMPIFVKRRAQVHKWDWGAGWWL